VACHNALLSLAAKGKKGRIFRCAVWIALGLVSLAQSSDIDASKHFSGLVIYGGIGLLQLFRKTPAEKALAKYLAESRRDNR
jgi:hypothetical protein